MYCLSGSAIISNCFCNRGTNAAPGMHIFVLTAAYILVYLLGSSTKKSQLSKIFLKVFISIFQLVGHVIKGGGVAVTGQDQSLLYSKDGLQPPVISKSLLTIMTQFIMPF